MFAYLFLLAAAASQQGVVSGDDYPPKALAKGQEGSTFFEVVIRPDGTPDVCNVLVSSGFKELDDKTCQVVLERARFKVITMSDGRPIYGVYRSIISWRISSPLVQARGPDFDLKINQVPPGVSLPVEIKVSYFHGANGSFSECQSAEPEKKPSPLLVDLACKAAREAPGDPIRNRQGAAVDAQDEALVKFSSRS